VSRRRSLYIKTWVIVPVLLAMILIAPSVVAAGTPRLVINGQLQSGPAQPVFAGNSLLVPLRVISESLGAQVDWDGATQVVTVRQYGHVVVLRVGKSTAAVDGKEITLDVPARLVNDRTMVPLRFVSEALGAQVSWDAKTNTATVSMPVAQIQNVTWQDRDGEEVLFIATSRPVQWRSFTLPSPDRIVIDIQDAVVGQPMNVAGAAPGVKQVRVGQFQTGPNVGRVVVDLESPMPYTVEAEAGGLAVHLAAVLQGISYQRLDGVGQVRILTSRPVDVQAVVEQNPTRLVVTLPATVTGPGVSAEPLVINDGVVGQIKLVSLASTGSQGGDPSAGNNPPAGTSLPGAGSVQLEIDLPYYLGHTISQQHGSGAVTNIDLTASPLYNKLIAVDPGHGGDDPGAHGAQGEEEKDLTLDIGLRLKALLEQAGARVLMIRSSDVTVGLYERPAIANQAGADAYVAIHLNAYARWKHGTEIYYYTTNPDSIKLATALHTTLIDELGLADGGIRKEHDFVVIRETTMPSSLVEVAYLTNPTEEKLLLTPSFGRRRP